MKLITLFVLIAGLWQAPAAAGDRDAPFDPFAEVEMDVQLAGSIEALLDHRGVLREKYRQHLGRLFNQQLSPGVFARVADQILEVSKSYPLIETRLWSRRATPFEGDFSGYLLHQNVRSIDLRLWDDFLLSECDRLRETDPAAVNALERERALGNLTVARPLETLATFLQLQTAHPSITSFKKMLEQYPNIIRFAGDPATELVANHQFAVRTSPRAIHSAFGLIRVKDCLVDMDSSERKILRARLFVPAIGGAATSMIFQNGKWTGQVLAIPFRMENAIHYSVEANGDLNHRILRSDQMSRSNAPREANVFDQWLGIAYSERSSQHSRMVVGTSMGAGLDSAKNIRSSIGWAASQKVGRAYKTKSADPEMEALFATDLNQDEPTWKPYVDKDQPERMVYEVTVKRAFTLHSLGNPAVTTQEQIGASAIRQKLNEADPNEIARILSRFATEPPRDPEIARILYSLDDLGDRWTPVHMWKSDSAIRAVFAAGGAAAIEGYLLSRPIDFTLPDGVLSVDGLRFNIKERMGEAFGDQALPCAIDYAVRIYLEARPTVEQVNDVREKLSWMATKTVKRLRAYAAKGADSLEEYLFALTADANRLGWVPSRVEKDDIADIFQKTFLGFLKRTRDPGALRQIVQIPLLAGRAGAFRDFLKAIAPQIRTREQFMAIVSGALDPNIWEQKAESDIAARSALLDYISLFVDTRPKPTEAELSEMLRTQLRFGSILGSVSTALVKRVPTAGLCVAYSTMRSVAH